MEEPSLTPGANGGAPWLDREHVSPRQSLSPSPSAEYGIKTSDLRSSPHPVNDNRNRDAGSIAGSTALLDSLFPMEEHLQEAVGTGRNFVEDTMQEGHSTQPLPELEQEAARIPQGVAHTEPMPSMPVTGERGFHHDISLDFLSLQSSEPLEDSMSFADVPTSAIGSEAPRIQAFAKLEFDDGQFYMNTYAVELGRDIHAARKAFQQDLQGNHNPDQPPSSQSRHRSNSSVDAAHGPLRLRSGDYKKTASSVVSESGGILNYDPYDSDVKKRPTNRKTKSEGSSSRYVPNKSFMNGAEFQQTRQESPVKPFTYAAQPVNPSALMPSPEECPLIPIHPPATADGAITGHRGISRRHVRIAYNFERRLFEMEVKGRNGAFVDEAHHAYGEITELYNGSYIQIGGVGIRFVLPNVALGETGAEGTQGSEAQSAMSFDFEDGRGASVAMADTDESDSSEIDERSSSSSKAMIESSAGSSQSDEADESGHDKENIRNGRALRKLEKFKGKESKPSAKNSQKSKLSVEKGPASKIKIKLKLKAGSKTGGKDKESVSTEEERKEELEEQAIKALGLGIPFSMIPPRRKGPGRPPKNGFMSKREEASLKKQAREAAKAQAAADGNLDLEAIKNSLDIAALDKRKYAKHKKFEGQGDDGDVRESIEGSDPPTFAQASSSGPKLPKEKKPKPPKSPSPFIDEAMLTAEQLAKPQQSYVVLIHEALTNAPTGQMSLPLIYKAIERRYPYFKFKVQTVGWQSSIRHNLSQHPAFRKVEREGKGWMWGLVPEVSIEKEKRPRRPSPPITQNNYYPPAPNMFRPPFPYQGVVDQHGNSRAAAQGQYIYPPMPGNGFRSPTVVRGLNGLPLPIPQNDTGSTYQSPYTSAPQSADVQTTRQDNENLKSGARERVQVPNGVGKPTGSDAGNPRNPTEQSHGFSLKPPVSGAPHQSESGKATAPFTTPLGPSGPLSEKTLDAVNRFRSIMIDSMSNVPHAEDIVAHSINRTLGIYPPQLKQKEYPEEKVIMDALRKLLDQIRETEQQEMERQEVQRREREQWEKDQKAAEPTVTHGHSTSHTTNVEKQTEPEEHVVPPGIEDPQEQSIKMKSNLHVATSSSEVLQASNDEASTFPVAPTLSPVTAPQSAQSRPTSAPSTGVSSKAEPSTSTSKPLAPDEKSQLLSLLQQLGQASNSARPPPPPVSSSSTSPPPPPPPSRPGDTARSNNDKGVLPSSLNENSNHGVKRKYEDSLYSNNDDQEDAEDAGRGGMGEMEASRSKRVAV
ncbi:MAG: hypothetical protein LQ340_004148 [Diploschistes diacapsis]|nr:MAG: hypothetical protein LQ340_004148 [Diploschistes diacapsis]